MSYLKQNFDEEDLFAFWTYGVFAIILLSISFLMTNIKKLYYYLFKVSIITRPIENKNLNDIKYEERICRTKDANDFTWHGWNIYKRYVTLNDIKAGRISKVNGEEILSAYDIPWVTDKMLREAKINCGRCQLNDECYRKDTPFCKHDEYGCVTEFDKFENK